MNIEIALNNINGKDVPAVTSLQVAEAFGKEHFNVLRDIETILLQVPENFRKLNFEVSEYWFFPISRLPTSNLNALSAPVFAF